MHMKLRSPLPFASLFALPFLSLLSSAACRGPEERGEVRQRQLEDAPFDEDRPRDEFRPFFLE